MVQEENGGPGPLHKSECASNPAPGVPHQTWVNGGGNDLCIMSRESVLIIVVKAAIF